MLSHPCHAGFSLFLTSSCMLLYLCPSDCSHVLISSKYPTLAVCLHLAQFWEALHADNRGPLEAWLLESCPSLPLVRLPTALRSTILTVYNFNIQIFGLFHCMLSRKRITIKTQNFSKTQWKFYPKGRIPKHFP